MVACWQSAQRMVLILSFGLIEKIVGTWVVFEGIPFWLEVPLLILLCIFLYMFVVMKVVRRFWQFPAPAFIGRGLNSTHRKRIQPPSMIVKGLRLETGMIVVEIGCGPGTFTIDVARAIAPKGTVYAVDIQEGMLEQLRNNIQKHGIENIVPILADAGGRIPLDDELADAAFSVTVLPEIPDRVGALREIHRVLKRDGFYADAELVIDPDWPLRRTVKKWASAAGFRFSHELGHVFRYVLVFQKT